MVWRAGGTSSASVQEIEMRIVWTLAILVVLGMTGLGTGSRLGFVGQAHAGCTPGRDC
jgi:hypothetical protein